MGGGVYSGDAGAQDWEKHLAELLGCLALSIIGGVLKRLRQLQAEGKTQKKKKKRKTHDMER